MWPFRSSRSSTFSMSKLGYLASRAPRAMFSRSRKTAIVASVVGLGMRHLISPAAMWLHRLEPVVVEAHTDPLGAREIGAHLVAQPALEQYQPSTLGRCRDPCPIGRAGVRLAG